MSVHHNPEAERGGLVKVRVPKSAPVCPSPSVHKAESDNAAGLAVPGGSVGACHVVSIVSVNVAVPEGALKVPEVVHQVLPDSVPIAMRQKAAPVFPRSGAGSTTLNLSCTASPSWTFTED